MCMYTSDAIITHAKNSKKKKKKLSLKYSAQILETTEPLIRDAHIFVKIIIM